MPKGVEPSPAGQRVWDAASTLFYQQGIRAVGVAEISERSGVARPNLYRNFQSKEGLVVAYLSEHSSADMGVFAAARRVHPDRPLEQLRYIVAATAEKIGAPGYRGCPLANAAIEFPDRSHPVRQRVDQHKKAFLERLTEMASQAVSEGADDLAYSLMMLMEGASCSAQLLSPQRSARVLIQAANDIISRYSPRSGTTG